LSLPGNRLPPLQSKIHQVWHTRLLADNRTMLVACGVKSESSTYEPLPGYDCSRGLRFLDLLKKRPARAVALKAIWLNSVASNAKGTCALCTGRLYGSIWLFDYNSGRLLNKFTAPALHRMALSQDASLIASVLPKDSLIHLWDTRTGKILRQLHGKHGKIIFLAFAPDGRTLASASIDGFVQLWRIK
jgi:WD40 repeat protein